MCTSILDSFIRKYFKTVSINNKKLKYQYSTTETMPQRQILFHRVAISHHNELSTDDIHYHLKSLITLPEWDKRTINMKNSKYVG